MVLLKEILIEESLEKDAEACLVKPSPNFDLAEKLPQNQFVIKETPNAGQGMFAQSDILPGTIILREKPLLVMPDKIFSDDDSNIIEDWLDRKLLKLSAENRKAFYDLADSRMEGNEKSILGIFFTNDMSFIDDSAALFPTMARVNHSCRPNADFISRPLLGVQDLVATRFIPQGQEIFISYLPASAEGSQIQKARRAYTREWYGFACTCTECCLKTNEKVRYRASKLHEKKVENLSLLETQELIECLIKIDSKLPHQSIVCKTGFEKALSSNDWEKAVQFFSAGFINDSILNSEDEEINHWNFVINSVPVCIGNQIFLFPN